ncbi:MAG: SurA N-terminal domain-containing protein [Candidatus Fonsibacter lacus]|jgi:SurA N-terminal domain
MSKKKFFLLLFFVFFLTNAKSKQLINNVIVSIDNSIITELDINKEINFVKFINKDQTTNNPELIKKEIINSLIDRKIKDIETNYYKIEVSEKEIENNLYNYLERIKINNETLNSFYNQNEIEKDYLKNIIKIDMKWSKLIRQMYEGRLNVNLTEVNRELEKEQKNTEEDEKLKKQLIVTEQNKLLNKFSATHLEKSKKKYLIKFL